MFSQLSSKITRPEYDGQFKFLAYFTGPVFALISVATIVFLPQLVVSGQDKGYVELLLAFITYIIGEGVSRIAEERRSDKRLRELFFNLENRLYGTSLITIMNFSEAYSLMAKSFKNAHAVRNTFIGMSKLSTGDYALSQNVILSYRDVLKKPSAVWEDIVGLEDLFDERFEVIDDKKLIGQHYLTVLPSFNPTMNFVLCGEQSGGFSEVYFGWIRVTGVAVCYSQDPSLIIMFNNYFNQLLDTPNAISAKPLYYGQKTNRRSIFKANWLTSWLPNKAAQKVAGGELWIKDIIGLWVSIYVKKDSRSETKSSTEHSPREYTRIEITYEGGLKVHGDNYVEGEHYRRGYHDSTAVSILNRSILYRYSVNEGFKSEVDGIAVYNLHADANNKLMGGYFVRDGAVVSKEVLAIKVESFSDHDIKSALDELAKAQELLRSSNIEDTDVKPGTNQNSATAASRDSPEP